MKESHFEAIVAGVGSLGAATAYFLASKGSNVMALEQFSDTPHDHGSHSGQSRIIRKAYFEHPAYVPLLQRAYNNWEELERLSGEKIFYKTGLIYYGPPDHEVIRGVKYASQQFGINVEEVDEMRQKEEFPFRCFKNRVFVDS
jgi:sarcosine oxidase